MAKFRPLLAITMVITLISLFPPADALATGWYGNPYATGPTLNRVAGTDDRWRLEYKVKCTRNKCKKTDEVASLVSKGIDPFSIATSVVKNHKTYYRTAEVIPQANPNDTCGVVGNIDYYVVKSDIDLSPPYTFRIEFTSSRTLSLVDPAYGQDTFSVQDTRNKCKSFSLPLIEPIAVKTQLSVEIIRRYDENGNIVLSLTCEFDPVTGEARCTDTERPEVEVESYPVENVFATLCATGVERVGGSFACIDPDKSLTIQLDSSKDQCFLGGARNPDATWYYYRGRWYCYGTECP